MVPLCKGEGSNFVSILSLNNLFENQCDIAVVRFFWLKYLQISKKAVLLYRFQKQMLFDF
jgi:hypothetical protein